VTARFIPATQLVYPYVYAVRLNSYKVTNLDI